MTCATDLRKRALDYIEKGGSGEDACRIFGQSERYSIGSNIIKKIVYSLLKLKFYISTFEKLEIKRS